MTEEEKKQAQREAVKRYREKNKEKIREKNAKYRAEHLDYFKQKKKEEMERIKNDPRARAMASEVRKRSYEKHKERRLAECRKWQEANIEHSRQYRKENSAKRVATARAWQLANPERYAAKQAEWRKNNMHILRKHIALRRARIMGATVGDPKKIAEWEKEWRGNETAQCYWCVRDFPVKECESDHVEPLSLGGQHCLENLVVACRKCNNKKRGKSLDKWLDIVSRDDWPTH